MQHGRGRMVVEQGVLGAEVIAWVPACTPEQVSLKLVKVRCGGMNAKAKAGIGTASDSSLECG